MMRFCLFHYPQSVEGKHQSVLYISNANPGWMYRTCEHFVMLSMIRFEAGLALFPKEKGSFGPFLKKYKILISRGPFQI